MTRRRLRPGTIPRAIARFTLGLGRFLWCCAVLALIGGVIAGAAWVLGPERLIPVVMLGLFGLWSLACVVVGVAITQQRRGLLPPLPVLPPFPPMSSFVPKDGQSDERDPTDPTGGEAQPRHFQL